MALIRYYRLGKNNLDGSALTNDGYYTYSSNNRLTAGTKMENYMSHIGKDISDDLRKLNLNEQFDLIYANDNNRLYLEANNIYRNNPCSYGSRVYTIFLIKCKIDGVETLMGTCTCYFEHVCDGVTYKEPTYVFIATDGVSNGYLQIGNRISHNWNSNKTFESFLCPYFQTPTTNPMRSAMYNLITKNCKGLDTDPWRGAGYAGIGGGDGTFDFTSDVIELPPIPAIDAVSTGFLQLFTDGLSTIIELSSYMWSTNFFDKIVKITANPLDIIMGLYMYPFIIPAESRKEVRAGNVLTGVIMGVPDSQIFEFDCGTIPVPKFYGAYLDHDPFTKCDIFLPYCGTFSLAMDDIVGKAVNVKYRVDLLTGACVAYIIVDGSLKYSFTGMCAINIPISSRSFESTFSAIMGVASSALTGGVTAIGTATSVASGVMQGKPNIQRSGNMSGNSGYLGVQHPYFVFTVPRVAIPDEQNKFKGYPIYASYLLSELSGYTEIEKIHLSNVGVATEFEKDKIIGLLEKGVIL